MPECDPLKEMQRSSFESKCHDLAFSIAENSSWKEMISENTWPYDTWIYEFTEMWAKLMQYEMGNGLTITEMAVHTFNQLSFHPIDEFKYKAVCSNLMNHWMHGSEFKEWYLENSFS